MNRILFPFDERTFSPGALEAAIRIARAEQGVVGQGLHQHQEAFFIRARQADVGVGHQGQGAHPGSGAGAGLGLVVQAFEHAHAALQPGLAQQCRSRPLGHQGGVAAAECE